MFSYLCGAGLLSLPALLFWQVQCLVTNGLRYRGIEALDNAPRAHSSQDPFLPEIVGLPMPITTT